LAGLVCTSCEDWFNVTSDSEIREDDHYSSVTGFQQSLIGCYIAMTDDALYGTNLSWFATEIIAHQFRLIETGLPVYFQNHLYAHSRVVPSIEGCWNKGYNVIANANEALKNIDNATLDEINYHIIKGELLALRAWMHFDLLRLYGYGNWANRTAELNGKLTIPYVTTLTKEMTPQSTGAEVIQLILKDLTEASVLLKDYDPITGLHDASFYETCNEEGFFNDRTLRMNYYAVRALQARVYLWQGGSENLEKALEAAEEVIAAVGNGLRQDEMYTYCYFLTPESLNAARTSMSVENVFGLNVSDMASRIVDYIKPSYHETESQVFYLDPDDALALYENAATDIRLTTGMMLNTGTTNQGYVPLKVWQGSLGTGYKDCVSMIRLPELYYIAAECYALKSSPNLALALQRLNTVREKRGLYTALTGLDATQILTEIKKEYGKEFLSEGVMFYYYKRTGATAIPRLTEPMSDAQYVWPYPAFELQSGRIQ
jgi:hypothetical protein